VICVDQGTRLGARKPLDTEGARETQQRSIESIELDEGRAAVGILRTEVEHIGTLAGEVQDREAPLAAHEWKLAALGQRLHERLAPEVLMNVDLHGPLRPFRAFTCLSIIFM
jgi:hypothetical protein